MNSILLYRDAIATFIAREFLGMLFVFQGADALFRIKPEGVIHTISVPLRNKGIPNPLIFFAVYFTSLTEFVGGLLLIVGYWKYFALYLLGLDLLIASFAFSLVNAMWDMKLVYPRLILLLFLLQADLP